MPPSGRPRPSPALTVRPIASADIDWIRAELERNWGGTRISSLGVWYDADKLPGFVAVHADHADPVGLATITSPIPRGSCEVITLSSSIEDAGVGTLLLQTCADHARAAGSSRIFLTTTNDNLRALGFYQKRGWLIVAIHRGGMDKARAIKPDIPLIGMNGIPLHDEIELELRLD
jgi:ribosomal protein S18 acetylase RimI-like enzyme